MKLKMISIFAIALILTMACDEGNEIERKQNELTKAKAELFAVKEKIANLEKELEELGVEDGNTNLTLVTSMQVEPKEFYHKVDFRGTVQSRSNVMISAESPAAVQQVHVVEGQEVKKGQILITQDGEILKKNIKELESSLDLAKTMYERQAKLWEQNIGTEVQYLEAKNRKESLELKLATTRTQLNKTKIRAPFNGIVDMVNIRVGEMAQPGVPIVRLVSLSKMYIKADVSESFVGKFKKGQEVEVYFPSTDVRLKSTVKAIGLVINPNNRTFELEVSIPDGLEVKPNMITVLSLADYMNSDAMVVPTKIIQSDRLGKFVFKLDKAGDETKVKRQNVDIGITYGNETEVKSGLNQGDVLIVKGGLGLKDGNLVKVVAE
jgi:membrane fusion protein (multidrug efflux system)